MNTKIFNGVAVLFCALLFFSCQTEPQEIAYDFDSCSHCKMTISDNRFGSELVTSKWKVYKFDAIECLVAYQKESEDEYAFILVSDYSNPGEFIDAKNASYLQSEEIPSPMGMNLSAFEDKGEADKILQNSGGTLMDWAELKKIDLWVD